MQAEPQSVYHFWIGTAIQSFTTVLALALTGLGITSRVMREVGKREQEWVDFKRRFELMEESTSRQHREAIQECRELRGLCAQLLLAQTGQQKDIEAIQSRLREIIGR